MSSLVLKLVVADDDEPICNLICDILSTFEFVTVIGKATTGKNLLELVKETVPDVVFVDVHMPDLNGLSVVHRLHNELPGIFIVFVTAHTQYAAEAFNLGAVDYLVKPLDRERVGRALDKVMRYKGHPQDGAKSGLSCMNVQENKKKLTLKIGHGMIIIDAEEILFVEKVKKKCIIHTKFQHYETSEQLAVIEPKLDPDTFFRCHKSYIINIHRVEKVLPYADRAYEITFYNYPHKVTMRRDRFKEFCRLIKY